MKKLVFLIFIPLFSFSNTDFEKGKALFLTSEFDSALVCFSSMINSCENRCHDTTLALYKTYLGKTYSVLEQYEKALVEFEQAISLMDGAGNYNGKAFAMISLAEMYRKSYKLEKAKSQMKEVFDLHRKHPLNKNNEAYMYNRYAAVINELEYISDEVYSYSNKVIEICTQTRDLDMKASSINELGYQEEKRKQFDAATRYYLNAYEIYKAQNNRIYIAQMMTNLARVSLYDNKPGECEKYLKQGIELTENTAWHDTKAGLLGFYSIFLYNRGRFKESRDILGKFVDAQMGKLQKQHSRTLVEMESKYELGKKSTQIELEKQKSQLAEAEASQKTQQRNYIAVGGILLAVLLVLLFLSHRKIKQTNASLNVALLDREALLKEVNHRVKNNLQVISSLLDLQAEHTQEENAKRQLLEGMNRINSIAQVHELMYSQDNLVNLNMKDYFTLLAEEIKNNLWKETNATVEINCANIEMRVAEAIPVGILLNELLTNSFKHAKPAGNLLEIMVALSKSHNEIKLHYKDNGRGKAPSSQEKKGIGTTIISSMVRQLHGKSETSFNGNFQFNLLFEMRANGKNSYR